MNPLILVEGLRYRYPDGTVALDGVDFRMEAGESVALLGGNGSGKTTFVLHLNGLLNGEGAIEVCGLPVIKKNLPAIRQKVGILFQDSENQLFLPTGVEDVAFGLMNQGVDPASALSRARENLQRVGLGDVAERAPYHLSAGEKKRAAIAGLLAMDPEILILDEPTTFLDPPGRRSLTELLGDLPQAKIVVTHDTRFAMALCKRAVFFERGHIAEEGPVDVIANRFGWSAALEQSKSQA